MLEPPPKRLRILQSVEVDETSPDYIAAQQKRQERFKGTLESIFAKYGTMHESQSDEIDLKGNIVVDRGHLRRAARHGALTHSNLLNSVVAGDVPEMDSDSDAEKEDSEDELAPAQPMKPTSAQKDKDSKPTVAPGAQSSPAISTPLQAQTPKTISAPIAQLVPSTPNPTANLLQYVQFPQTPAGQQAQNSFYAALTQSINHAVQQAVAPFLSGILPSTVAAQSPSINIDIQPPPTTPANTVDTVSAAKDPKWFFPPLPEQSRERSAARIASASRAAVSTPPRDDAEQQEQVAQDDEATQESCEGDFVEQTAISVATLVRSQEPVDMGRSTRRSSPRVEVQNSSRRQRTRYQFTEDEDVYIAKRKARDGWTWARIRSSKMRWAQWPERVFCQRYNRILKDQKLHLRTTPEVRDPQIVQGASEDECSAMPAYHPPTPDSLEQEDSHACLEIAATPTQEHVLSSSTYFDEDERDLLSMAGDMVAEEQLQYESDADDTYSLDEGDTILPSVEGIEFVDEDTLQQGLLEGSPLPQAGTLTTVNIKEESAPSSPINQRKRRKMDVSCREIPDSESDANIDSIGLNSSAFMDHNEPRLESPSLDLTGDDELQANSPLTKAIKREFSTPPPASFLVRTPVAHSSQSNNECPSSGIKSVSGLSRKAYLKKIKQSWTKTSTPTGKTVAKRRSFHTLPSKRARAEIGDSEDELGF